MFNYLLFKPYFLLGLLLYGFAIPSQAILNNNTSLYKTNTTSITIGVLAFRDQPLTIQRWTPLIDHLNISIPKYNFKLAIGNLRQIEQKVKQQSIDFILTQPSHYVALAFKYDLSSPLVSKLNRESPTGADLKEFTGYSQLGGVIFTLANRDDINELNDLENKTIATASKKALGGFQAPAYELLQQGINFNTNDFHIVKTGLPHKNVIQAVLNKQADAGFIRTGILEEFFATKELSPEDLKIINQQDFKNFSLIVSTRLYPEWPFAALGHTDKAIVEDVMIELLKIEIDSQLAQQLNIAGFTIAEDYRVIDQLLKSLMLPPFDQKPEATLLDIWQQWHVYISTLVLLIALILAFLLFRLYIKNRLLSNTQKDLIASNKKIQKLSLAVYNSPIRITITNSKGQIEYVNHAVLEQSGYSFEELYLKNPSIFASGENSNLMYDNLWQTIKQGTDWAGELINLNKQGQRQILETTITPIVEVENGSEKISGFLSIQRDVTKEKKAQHKVDKLAFYDSLTNLANRTLLEKRIHEEILRQIIKRNSDDFEDIKNLQKCFYLTLINIDRFKVLNDAMGKEAGDVLLIQFAEKLKQFAFNNALLARLSADEFAIFFSMEQYSNASKTKAKLLQKNTAILKALKTPFYIKEQEVLISVSIGVTSLLDDNATSVNDVVKHADMAMHFAKSKQGNQVQFYNTTLKESAIEYFQMEQDLKTALAQNQFMLYYQAQVNLSGEIVGAEALIRWVHPTKGFIPPNKFINIAEKSDLIVDIGNWVLQEACQQAVVAFKTGFKYDLSINISPKQFLKTNFATQLNHIIKETSMPEKRLTLEITEGLFFHNIEETLPKMQKFTKRGIKFSIDDFGTGYSSLSYLKNLPIEELKIDRTFIKGIPEDDKDIALVETILAIANNMKFNIVAEGIETQQQAEFFHHQDNITLQGFLYSKPLPFDEFCQIWQKKMPSSKQNT